MEHKGEILERVDSSKIAHSIETMFNKHYEPRIVQDYLLTAEALNLVDRVSKVAYGLTDYGLFVSTSVTKEDLESVFITEFEKYIYLLLLIKRDYDYVLGLLRCLEEMEPTHVIRSILSKSRCPSLERIRKCFQKQLVEIISDLNLGLEGTELAVKMRRMKKRTLNHRLSSLLFWLIEIVSGCSLIKPRPRVLQSYEVSSYLEMLSKLEKSLSEFDQDQNIDSILDDNFPQLFSHVFDINANLPKEKDSEIISSGIIAMLQSEWNKFARLQPYPFRGRISALPFLLYVQSRFLFENKLCLPFSKIMDIFKEQIQSFGYLVTWRYDFHSGYIEKVS